MRSKLACALAACGFEEAARECRDGTCAKPGSGFDVDGIVEAVLRKMSGAQG